MTGFPGFNPNGAQAPAPAAPAGPYVIEIPADPTWEPMEFGDVLDKDGAFHFIITAERAKAGDKPGVFFTLTIQDEDFAGKRIVKFLADPRVEEKQMFLWRGLMLSIWGKEGARQAISYSPGKFTGAHVFAKTEAFFSNGGDQRTGLGAWLTADEYTALVQSGKHRWDPKPRQTNAGAPAGLPAGFPGFPVPQPGGASPVQTAPQPATPVTQPASAPQAAVVQPQGFAALVPSAAPPAPVTAPTPPAPAPAPAPAAPAFPAFPGFKK